VSYKRFVVAGLVMAGGVALAWPFRHAQPLAPQPLSVNHEAPDLTWSPPQDLTLQVHSQPGQSPAPELPPVSTSPGRLARPAAFQTVPANEPPIEALPAPPYLPMSYESLLVPVGSEPAATRINHGPDTNLPVHEPLLPSADEVAAAKEAQRKPGPLWRKHRIVEGDTLATLAQRYLGDASRSGEIHVANIDRLANPEILPLGVTLLIPPRVAAEAASFGSNGN
jgi:hypothetical protein